MIAKLNNQQGVDEAFILEHTPLIKRIAYHLLGRLPACVQVDDLVQAGMVGLLEAARKFDPKKEVKFTTFAGIRIRGAMLDEVRKGDWAPRSVHRNSRMIAEAIRVIEHQTAREAKDPEVANMLNLCLSDYYRMLQDTSGTKILAFDDLGIRNDFLGFHKVQNQMSVVDTVQKNAIKEQVSNQIACLPEKEKRVIILYYDAEFNLKEIGRVLGVTESRVSQLHGQGVKRLRQQMGGFKEAV